MFRKGPRRRNHFAQLLALVLFVLFARWFFSSNDRSDRPDEDERDNRAAAIERAIAPPEDAPAAPGREGIAAVVLMDVSGSMRDSLDSQSDPKIAIARRAALDLVRQFDRYAGAHPEEPVLVGLFEFSGQGEESTREIIPLSPPDPIRAEKALAKMHADGGTPIGNAMIAGKRALDRTGLSRRHLLVVTDGENSDGYEPSEVMSVLMKRPEAERPSVYFVAFDIAASRFDAVRNGGGLVLGATNAQELNDTFDFLLTGKILVEGN